MSSFWRDALADFIENPGNHEKDVVYQDKDCVIIRDLFPKSRIHYLILPRDNRYSRQHPLSAFDDEDLKRLILRYTLIAKEKLQEEFEQRYKFIDDDLILEDFVQEGVHAVPSMKNLHIHVMTKDLSSPKMKNRRHYNTFNTAFFVPLTELPLDKSDARWNAKKMESLVKETDLICHYCNHNFGNRFAKLSVHLDDEFRRRFRER